MKSVWQLLKKYAEVIGYVVLTSLLLGACFVPILAWVAAGFAIIFAGLLHNEPKIFALMLYLHCFYTLFNYHREIDGIGLDVLLAGVLIFIILILYVCRVIKHEYKLNWKTLVPISLFLVYVVLPFHQCAWKDFFGEVFFLAVLYILFEERKSLDFRMAMRVLTAGLLVSCLMASLRPVSPLLNEKIIFWDYLGIFRFSGLTYHPNTLYVLIVLAMCGMLLLYTKKQISLMELMFAFITLFVCGYFTLSRAFLVTSVTGIISFMVIDFVHERGKALVLGVVLLAIMCLIGGVFFGTTRVYFKRVTESHDIEFGIHNSNFLITENLKEVFDNKSEEEQQAIMAGETYFDPGRPDLRRLYLRDWLSSPRMILFGCGISRPLIGQMSSHNLCTQELWKHGLVGYCFYLAMIIGAINWKKLKHWLSCLPIFIVLLPYILVTTVELCSFNYIDIGVMLCAFGFLENLISTDRSKNQN